MRGRERSEGKRERGVRRRERVSVKERERSEGKREEWSQECHLNQTHPTFPSNRRNGEVTFSFSLSIAHRHTPTSPHTHTHIHTTHNRLSWLKYLN